MLNLVDKFTVCLMNRHNGSYYVIGRYLQGKEGLMSKSMISLLEFSGCYSVN